MEKTKYYVSVQARSILADQGAAAYELEILASDREVEQLQELFNTEIKEEDDTFVRAMTPGIPYHIDDDNDVYDYYLIEIYKKIYELGTVETQSHIKNMNILK
jgi:deferrochelatase/peroxidase EfeB